MNTNKLILGKIFTFLSAVTLYGDLNVSVDKKEFQQGDEITIELEAIGEDVVFPTINTINGFTIENYNKLEKSYLLDGKPSKLTRLRYTLLPKSSFVVPPFEVAIDGVKWMTNPIEVKKIEPIVSTKEDEFQLILEAKKEKVYVGEPIVASITFKHKVSANILKYEIESLHLENFTIKEDKQPEPIENQDYKIYKTEYLLFPQKAGKYELPNQLINVAWREPKTNFIKWKRIYSQSKTFDVTPLPNNLSLVGKYSIKATVESSEVASNKPVNVTIEIEGFGNIDEIKEFSFDIPNTMGHSSKPFVETKIENGKYGGKFTQKISLISEIDFQIPALGLEFFNPTTNEVERIATKPIDITIKDEEKESSQIETTQPPQIIVLEETKLIDKVIYIVNGILFGLFLSYGIYKIKTRKRIFKEKTLVEKIQKAKNHKELYNLLLPFAKTNEFDTYIKLLEENIYFQKNHTIDKEDLCEIVEKYSF